MKAPEAHGLAQERAEPAGRAVETPGADRAAERKPARLALTTRLATAEAEAARLRTLVEEWRELLHQDAEQIASWKAAHAGLCAEVLALRAQVPAAPGDATLASAQRAHAERILRVCGGCVSEAARLLGISRSTLTRWQRRWVRADARRGVEQSAPPDERHAEAAE